MIFKNYILKAPDVFMNWDLILKVLSLIFEVVKFVKKTYDEMKKNKKNKNNRKHQ